MQILIIKHSGVGADDDLLERRGSGLPIRHTLVAFWDVDAPATLARVEKNASDPFRPLISHYDFIFTYGGGATGCGPLPDARREELLSDL